MKRHENTYEIQITERDRLLRAWENSMELVRDFEAYAGEMEDGSETQQIFSAFARDEGMHAAKLREILYERQNG